LADAHGRLWRQVVRASGGAADKTGLLALVLVAEWTARRMLNRF
jgi:hypothetical protein